MKRIILGISSFALLGLAGAALAHSSIPNISANAEVWKQGATVYFIPSDTWLDGTENFRMNVYDGSTYKTVVLGENYLKHLKAVKYLNLK